MGKFDIHNSFNIVDDERTRVGQGRGVFRSQPDLQMGERAVPIQYLNDESKDEAKEVKDFYDFIFDSPNGSDEKKNDPEKMDDHHTICKDLVDHFWDSLRISMGAEGATFSLATWSSTIAEITPMPPKTCSGNNISPKTI